MLTECIALGNRNFDPERRVYNLHQCIYRTSLSPVETFDSAMTSPINVSILTLPRTFSPVYLRLFGIFDRLPI